MHGAVVVQNVGAKVRRINTTDRIFDTLVQIKPDWKLRDARQWAKLELETGIS